MKKLTRYILWEHVGPFLFAFVTITFLLIVEHIPKILDHVIDKDVSIWVAMELVALNLAWMLALSVPMSVLVAVLMAFGRLTSDMEITAIKASGINLLRVIVPLLVVGCALMYGMIEFQDKVLPDINKRARLLWGDIATMRPTLVFRAGIFVDDIPGYLVQIDDIDHATSRLRGVRITETKNHRKPRIVVAEYGFMKTTEDGSGIQFTLYNGEQHELDLDNPDNYSRLDFQKHVINIAKASSEFKRTDQEYRTDREMPIAQMQETVARAKTAIVPFREKIRKRLATLSTTLFNDSAITDTTVSISDSTAYEQLVRAASAQYKTVERNRKQIYAQQKMVNKYTIEIYKKYSLPAASLAFILIGAPLAVLSRRGGMGTAIAISILLFVVYWAFLIGGEDLADRRMMSPFLAMWGANILIGGIGLYLLYKVVTEKPLFAWFRQTKRKRNHDKKD